jgi:cytochrome c oxidase assembly protein subunit 15
VWTVARLSPRPRVDLPLRIRAGAIGLLILVFLQIYLGALVAGLDAGLVYNTWPLMEGRLVPLPADLFALQPVWHNLFENRLTVQFEHRLIAVILWAATVLHAAAVARTMRGAVSGGALALAIAVTFQGALGIVTLLLHTPVVLALAHQAMAMIVLAIAVIHAESVCTRRAHAPAVTPVLSSP